MTNMLDSLTTFNAVGPSLSHDGVSQSKDDGFSPSQIADLLFWHDARTNVQVSGSDVTQWNDLSGNGNHAVNDNNAASPPQFVASHANFNGLPAVDMAGSVNDRLEYLALSSGGVSDYTFFFVLDPVSTAANQTLFDTQSGRMVLYQETSAGSVGFFDGTQRNIAAPTVNPQTLTFSLGGGTGEVFRDGSSLGSAVYTQKAILNATGLGGRPLALGASLGYGGFIGSAICYTRQLTTIERNNVLKYLGAYV